MATTGEAGRRATVIGGHGFIGQHLVRYLRSRGWDCWVPGRDAPWPLQECPLGCVFYCAGLTADYGIRPFDTVEAHVSLVARVLQSSHYDSLVYLSSTRLYDGLTPEGMVEETAALPLRPHDPRHLYDLTKLTGEAVCHAVSGGRARIARLSCVYDPHEAHEGFLPTLLRQVAAARPGETVEIDSSPHFARDYVHVDDVIRVLEWLAVWPGGGVYNIAMGGNVRNEELASCVRRHTGRRIVFGRTEAGSVAPTISIETLRRDFGWQPRGITNAIADWAQATGCLP